MEEEDTQNPVSVALASLSSGYTTPEAQQLARRTFNELYNERGQYSAEEQAAMRQLDATAQSAKDALKSARDKLLSQRYNEQAKWFALAGAFGQGSKSGRFGENLGRVGNTLAEHSMARRKFEDERDMGALKMLGDMQGIDAELVKQKLAMLKARRDADKGLMTESLKVLGREIRPRGGGASNMSPFGKIAADEGFVPGTPQFTRRVNTLYNADMAQRQKASGVDVDEVNPEDQQILASTYGVPISPVDPFRGLSTKARQAAIQRSMDVGTKALSSMDAEDSTAQAAIRQIDRFMALNEKQASGPIYGIPGVSWLTGMSAAAQEMDQIRADIARKQRQPGEGQVSNFDAAQFLIASPGRGKTYAVNKNIGKGIKIAKQLQLEQHDFMRNYLAVNRHTTGAKEAWNKYLEANPIFDPAAKPGSFELNGKRVAYQDWFRAQMAPKEEAEEVIEEPVATLPGARQGGHQAASISEDVPEELEGLSPEERSAAMRPAFAKGGKVQALANVLKHPKAIALESAIDRLLGRVNATPSINLPAPPVNPALMSLGSRREALMRALAENPGVNPLDAEQAQATNAVLETVLANANKNGGVNVGMRAESLMRTLQDIASKYSKPAMAEGGEVKEETPAQTRARRALLAQMARQMAQGTLYNFSDELAAGGDEERLREERAALEDFSNENPLSAMGLQGLGAAPTGAAAGYAGHKLLNAMRGSGPSFHPRLGVKKGKAAAAAALLERVLPKSAIGKMMASGAVSGAVAGAGASQGDRGEDAAQQAAVGSVLGPVGGLAAKYGLGAVRRGVDYLRGTTPRVADEKVLTALARDTTNLDDVVNRMTKDRRAGVPSMIGDAAGKNTASLTEAVAGKSGRGPAELAEKMEKRQLEQGTRVEDRINKGLKPSEYFAEEQKLKDELYGNAAPLYEAAYKGTKPIPVDAVAFLYDSKAGTRAMKDAVENMNTRGIPIGRKDFFGRVNKLSLQSLDYVKQALDDAITKEEGKGATYVATSRGSALRSLRNKLRDVLDNSSPAYKDARAQYAGDLEVLDALRTGREQFAKLSPKQVENLVSNMSFAEKDAFRTGVAQTLFEAIGRTPRGSNVASRVIGTPALTEKLAFLFDKPRDAAAFNDALLRELQLHKQSQGAIANATRQRAASASQGLDDTPLANAADFALDAGQQAVFLPGIAQNTGGAWSTARLMQWVRNRLPMSEKTANEAADMLGVDDPKVAKEVIERLRKEGQRLKDREDISNRVRDLATRSTAVATAPDPWAQSDEGYGKGGKVKAAKKAANLYFASVVDKLGNPFKTRAEAESAASKMRARIVDDEGDGLYGIELHPDDEKTLKRKKYLEVRSEHGNIDVEME